MKIAIYGELGKYTDRGISRYVNKLFSTVKLIYPQIEFYIINPSEEKIKVNFENINISNTPSALIKHGIQFIVFFHNGVGAEEYTDKIPGLQTASIIHDIIDVVCNEENAEVTGIVNDKNLQMRNLYQKRVDNADIIFTVSKYSKSDILNYLDVLPNKPLEVIYPAPLLKVEKDYIKTNIINEPYFLYNGGYCTRKGILQLVYNFIDLKIKKKLKSKLVLTGINYLTHHKLLNSLIKYGIQNGYIIDKGYVKDKDLISLYKNALAMVYPSSYEGFGIPLVEAMSFGCPVITCDNTSISEVCGKNSAYYINKFDGKNFQRVLMLFESEEFAPQKEKLIKNAYENVKRFSWEESAHKFVKVLKDNEGNSYTNKLNQLETLLKEAEQKVNDIRKIELKLHE